MKKWLIKLLAVVGVLSLGRYAFVIVRYQSDAKVYLANCQKVEPGMTLMQAKQVMGDYNWSKRANRSEVWTYIDNSPTKQYYLTYPAPALASGGTDIYFNPETQVVTRVVCGKPNLHK